MQGSILSVRLWISAHEARQAAPGGIASGSAAALSLLQNREKIASLCSQ
ncbi:hypothetical protein [Syntrophomonas palmitatica]|nr:hypothetical protein [Syntrophomonas palmitatica]